MYQSRKEKWKKKIWIAKKIGVEIDDDGYEIPIFDKPIMYKMNVQPISSEAEIVEFGEHSTGMQKAVINLKEYLDKFEEFDVAYLDGVTPDEEKVNGENANYRLYPPRNQNKVITLYFKRLAGR